MEKMGELKKVPDFKKFAIQTVVSWANVVSSDYHDHYPHCSIVLRPMTKFKFWGNDVLVLN